MARVGMFASVLHRVRHGWPVLLVRAPGQTPTSRKGFERIRDIA